MEGLTNREAAERLERDGPNALAEPPPTSIPKLLIKQLLSPLIAILAGAAVVTAWIGDLQDTVIIGIVVALNAIVGATQERRADASVRALQRMIEQRLAAGVLHVGQHHPVAFCKGDGGYRT